jgi:hypothetical protein
MKRIIGFVLCVLFLLWSWGIVLAEPYTGEDFPTERQIKSSFLAAGIGKGFVRIVGKAKRNDVADTYDVYYYKGSGKDDLRKITVQQLDSGVWIIVTFSKWGVVQK